MRLAPQEEDLLNATAEGVATPWPLDQLLRNLEELIARYVVLPGEHERVAVVLWIVHTWVFEKFETTPYLAITSPEKQSGKTRFLTVLQHLVARPWVAVLPSEAVVFRKIEASKPTLLLDEVDTIFGPKAGEHEGLRALLNAGFQSGAAVPRCVGKGFTIQDFAVYCPKALAGIGDLPDTVADRSIQIRMRRRARYEMVERFRRRDALSATAPILAQVQRWAATCKFGDDPRVPDELSDRAADAWEPLLAIADAAAHGWPEKARAAAIALSGPPAESELSLGVRLLTDARGVWREGEPNLFTRTLCERLNALDESLWGSWSEGKGIDPRALSKHFRRYGVRSRDVRVGAENAKGYRRADLVDLWFRYCPSGDRDNLSATSVTTQRNQAIGSDSDRDNLSDSRGHKYAEKNGCHAVTGESIVEPEEGAGERPTATNREPDWDNLRVVIDGDCS